ALLGLGRWTERRADGLGLRGLNGLGALFFLRRGFGTGLSGCVLGTLLLSFGSGHRAATHRTCSRSHPCRGCGHLGRLACSRRWRSRDRRRERLSRLHGELLTFENEIAVANPVDLEQLVLAQADFRGDIREGVAVLNHVNA